MDKFLETHLLKWDLEEMENLSRLITSKEIQSVATTFQQMKILGLNVFTDKFYQIFKEVAPILLKSIQ